MRVDLPQRILKTGQTRRARKLSAAVAQVLGHT